VNPTETADEVRLSFRVYDRDSGDRADTEQVTLDAPLGDRRVIHDSTGEALREAGEGCFTASPPSMDCERRGPRAA
jgi:hypothetical protein